MQEILGYAQTAVSAATMAAVLVIAILAKMYIERLLKRLEAMLGGSAEPEPDKRKRYQYIGGDVITFGPCDTGQSRGVRTAKGTEWYMHPQAFAEAFKEKEVE